MTVDGVPQQFGLVCSLSVLSQYALAGPAPTYVGQARDYCRSLARLQALSPDIFLSNHGGFFGLADKSAARRAGDAGAFIDRDGYRQFLTGAGAAIERALAAGGLGSCDALTV